MATDKPKRSRTGCAAEGDVFERDRKSSVGGRGMADRVGVHHGFGHELSGEGKTNVWLTPKKIIDVLGPFDLDPCAAPEPRPWPTARKHFVVAQDGLSKPWHGLVWLNPPYGKETGIWLDRLAEHGNGIALIFARTETRWFQSVASKASVAFFPAGRISFFHPDGSPGSTSPGAPSVFLAFGEEAKIRLIKSGLRGIFYENSIEAK